MAQTPVALDALQRRRPPATMFVVSASGSEPVSVRRVSAVIVAFQCAEDLPRALDAVARVAGIDAVIVVDHGRDGSSDIAKAFGAVVLTDASNPGFGTGQNHGVALTTTEYILMVNPDAVIDPDGVRFGVELLDAVPGVAGVQGVIRSRATGQPERSQGLMLRPTHLFGRALGARRLLGLKLVRSVFRHSRLLADHVDRLPDGPTDVESLAATALLIRRSAFDEVGGFDQTYFLYGEDLDLCQRLRAAGWRLVALPVEWAEHASGSSSAGWWDRELVWWEGTLQYAARWWTPTAWAAARIATVLRTITLLSGRPRQASQVISRLVVAPRRARQTRPKHAGACRTRHTGGRTRR